MPTLRLPARLESVKEFQTFVRDKIQSWGIKDASKHIELTLEEILVNVIRYAYPGDGGDVEVTCNLLDNRELRVVVADWGQPFNPLIKKSLDPHQDLQSRPIGGWGITLVREMVDKLEYHYRDGKNILKVSFPANDP